MTAIKFHHMLPDKFPYPLHNSTDRREEKIFFDPSHTAMQWFGYGRQHALLMGIRAQDHITLGIRLKGTFQDLYNQTREMFYMQKGNVYYAGTYKCLRIEQIINNPEIVESLDISLISKAFKADMIKAAVHAQPPTNDLTSRLDLRKMTELCYNGTIKFEWVALQCMGFDEDVFQALGGQYVAPSVPIVGHVLKLLHTSTAEQGIPQLSEDDSDASIDNT
ncbi:hypothetical protein J3R30DRAFT_699058 [Lentinula aciculospora]|uniref:Uncharacterized protein n=1 Tax=Lentinula aciculospora TaxID=153920 RepID=A0A9W9A607_9AGAR|nr:hypothetical protein J3R30DRAFT_699058 [Lentinula aciculospora]